MIVFTANQGGNPMAGYIIGASGQMIWCPPTDGEKAAGRFALSIVGALAVAGAILGLADLVGFIDPSVELTYELEWNGADATLYDVNAESDIVGVQDAFCSDRLCTIVLADDAGAEACRVVVLLQGSYDPAIGERSFLDWRPVTSLLGGSMTVSDHRNTSGRMSRGTRTGVRWRGNHTILLEDRT
ncbi:MAG: hypothetical protein ABIG71_04475 [Candidatus Uhrbacteria bacterium]